VNLILKEPGIQRFPLLQGALQPDVTVYIKRHPIAILNSYRRARLYEGWNVARQFTCCCKDITRLRPDLAYFLTDVSDQDAQILSMCCIAHYLADEWAAMGKLIVVDYEELAFGGPSVCPRLFSRLGLEFDEDKTAEMNRLFFPKKAQNGFLDTHKVSAQRANAYLSELAPWQLAKARRYLERVGYSAESPSQTVHGQVSGSLEYCRRQIIAMKRSVHSTLSHAVKRFLASNVNPPATRGSSPRYG